jgi:dTDP-glucose 4,6-dehydratase
MSRLLVTGGAGFIGSNFVHYWLAEHPGDRIVVIDALTYAGCLTSLQPVNQRPELRFIRGNICDTALIESTLADEEIDTIVHFAAESHVDRSIHAPDAFIETNIIGTHSLLKAARKVWLGQRRVEPHRFHHVSTDEVFGSLEFDDPAFHELTPYAPNSPYSASKAASDHLVRAYHKTYGLQVTTSRCTNNYGPYQFPEKLIPLTIINILRGRPLHIYGDGLNVRDWLYVVDHCRGIDLILRNGVPGETYNIGGGAESGNTDLVRQLCEIADEELRANADLRLKYPHSPATSGNSSAELIQFVPDRPGHDRRYATDCAKISQQLGYQSHVGLDAGLRETLSWYLKNEDWWRRVMDGSYFQWLQTQYRQPQPEPALAAS